MVDESGPMRPLPYPTDDSAPYWEAMNRHELLLQRCLACGHVIYLPAPMCSECQSFDLEHFTASGRGRVYSWTVVRHMGHPAFEPPYAVLLVEVEEGPRIIAQLASPNGDEWERLEVGTPVRIAWDDSEPEQSFAIFEIDTAEADAA